MGGTPRKQERLKAGLRFPQKIGEGEDNVVTGALLPCCFLKDRRGPVISKCCWMHEGFCTAPRHIPCCRARQSRASLAPAPLPLGCPDPAPNAAPVLAAPRAISCHEHRKLWGFTTNTSSFLAKKMNCQSSPPCWNR